MQWINYSLMWSYTVSHYHLFFCIVLVALQFPEGLLVFACTIADILERYGWLPSFCPQFSIHFLNSWHQRKGSIVAGWRSASNGETVKNPWSSQISLLDSLCLGKVPETKFPSQIICLPLLLLLNKFCESRINFLNFQLLPPLLRQFPLFESHFSLNSR